MNKPTVELCPETGICSVIRQDGRKADLMPDEVEEIREAAGNPEKIRSVIAESDPALAEALNTEEIIQISNELK